MFDNVNDELHRDLESAISKYYIFASTMLEDGTHMYSDADINDANTNLTRLVQLAVEETESKRVGLYMTSYNDMFKWNNNTANNPNYNEAKHSYRNLWNRYDGQVPIFARKTLSKRFDHKVNNKINNDFFSEIINDKVSFTMGKPPTYAITEGETPNLSKELDNFIKFNNLGAIDRDTFLTSSITGSAYRFYTVSGYNNELTLECKQLAPWSVVFFQETDYINSVAIIISYNNKKANYHVYSNYVSILMDDDGVNNTWQDSLFKMPVIEYSNNNLKISDCDKVLELIDAYDRLISDTSNELEQMRLAYLSISGGQKLTKDEARDFKQQLQDSGVLHLPDSVTANFLIKTVDMTSTLSFLTVIENNIYRFSNSINYSNSKFTGGQLTGIALKQATTNLRNKCLNSWLSFDDANWYQWQILAEFIKAKYVLNENPVFNIEGYIKLNIPTDNKEIAETMNAFKGSLSTKTILRLAELDIDIDSEIEEMTKEGIFDEVKTNKIGLINE